MFAFFVFRFIKSLKDKTNGIIIIDDMIVGKIDNNITLELFFILVNLNINATFSRKIILNKLKINFIIELYFL